MKIKYQNVKKNKKIKNQVQSNWHLMLTPGLHTHTCMYTHIHTEKDRVRDTETEGKYKRILGVQCK